MEDDQRRPKHADLGDLHLETWEADGGYFWRVKNMKSGVELGTGEAVSIDEAMMAASAAAGTTWERLTWRGIGPEF